MKYIKKLNIDFDNWEEVDLDDKGPIKFNKSEEYYKKLVGKKVKIIKNTIYYDNGDNNPKDIIGIIIRFDSYDYKYTSSKYYFRVKWNNGKLNSYRINDLELV